MSHLLNEEEIAHFITEGFVRIDAAFSPEIASAALEILWKDIPFDRFDPATWTEPVIRLGMYDQEPFVASVNTAVLQAAFNKLVGPGKWLPCGSVGTFPVRFPSRKQPNDTGPHVDAGFPGKDPNDFFEWRVNVRSRGRALLMLMLYSDVGVNDAPTLVYKRSHRDVAKLLSTEGDAGLSFMELAGRLHELPAREAVSATGKAGTVYLCHPFLVHAAQPHTGSQPKFMAQPPLRLHGELSLSGSATGYTPVEQAIRLGLE